MRCLSSARVASAPHPVLTAPPVASVTTLPSAPNRTVRFGQFEEGSMAPSLSRQHPVLRRRLLLDVAFLVGERSEGVAVRAGDALVVP
jgi:hypothetical protein